MAKKKLVLRKEFSKGATTRHVAGFGVVTFDPTKVEEKDYENYEKKGFDIFETSGKTEMTRAEFLDSENNATAIKEIATEMGVEFDKKAKKATIIELIVKAEAEAEKES